MYSRNRLPMLVKKKDGTVEKFQKSKIETSLIKTLQQSGKRDKGIVNRLIDEICLELSKIKKKIIEVDKIRKVIVKVLKRNKMSDVAEVYDFVFLHIKGLKLKKAMKRDGRIVRFEPYKIFKSISKSFDQAGVEDGKKCEEITKEVVNILNKKFAGKVVPVESIKDTIEHVLVRRKLPKVAHAYLLYRYM